MLYCFFFDIKISFLFSPKDIYRIISNEWKVSTREITILALITALNSLSEVFGGGLLHLLNIPFTGNIMIAINLIIYLTAKMLVPRNGSIAIIGFVTALVRFINTPGFSITPGLAIFLESLIAESILSLAGVSMVSAIISGITLQIFAPVFRMFSLFILYGWEMRNAFSHIINGVLPDQIKNIGIISIIIAVFIFTLLGLITGFFAYNLAKRIVIISNLQKKHHIVSNIQGN